MYYVQAMYLKFVENVDTLVGSWYIVKRGLYLASKKLYGHEAKIPICFYMKGRYSAWVMHRIWIPYSNGFMLK